MSRGLFWLLFTAATIIAYVLRTKWRRFLSAKFGGEAGSLWLVGFAIVLAGFVVFARPPQDRWLLALPGFFVLLAIIGWRRR